MKETKFFFPWQEEKEMKYLEDKAMNGYFLEKIAVFRYHFIKGEPKKIKYQADFRVEHTVPTKEYLELFKEVGWDHVCSTGGWNYFCSGEGDTSIFTDNHSIVEKYKRLLWFLGITGLPLYYSVFILNGSISYETIGYYRYFFIAARIMAVLHLAAIIRIFIAMRKYNKNIHE